MTPHPLTIIEPQLAMLVSGRLRTLFRPDGVQVRRWQTGQVLWIREPFYLDVRFTGLSPSAALRFGAAPLFTVNVRADADLSQWGPRRIARTLPRAWHRQHLVLTAIERRALQAITQDEILAQGFTTRAAFAARWDRNLDLRGSQDRDAWARDPLVHVLHFDWVPTPVLAAGVNL